MNIHTVCNNLSRSTVRAYIVTELPSGRRAGVEALSEDHAIETLARQWGVPSWGLRALSVVR